MTDVRSQPGPETVAVLPARRDAALSRSAAYALFSQLVASPWDEQDPLRALPPADLDRVSIELSAALPFALDLTPLATAAARVCDPTTSSAAAAKALASAYGSLFEVGSDGPAVAVCEAQAEGRPESSREEIVRFYEFFGYGLRRQVEWRPDHLSVELEFLHFLAFRETRDAAAGLRLGQLDFLERHLLSWVPASRDRLAALLEESDPTPAQAWFLRLFEVLSEFLARDAAWQTDALDGES